MDMTKYATKEFLSSETVQNQQVFELTILNQGENKTGMFGDQCVFEVNYGDKDYLYSPNGETVTNLIDAYGTDSRRWINKTVDLEIKKNKNDNFIIVGKGKVEQLIK